MRRDLEDSLTSYFVLLRLRMVLDRCRSPDELRRRGHGRLLWRTIVDLSDGLSLYRSSLDTNHTDPNPFAQTLRIFFTRLLRLFPRFEWLGQRRELKTDIFEKQPLLDDFGHPRLIARRWSDRNRTGVQSLGSFNGLRTTRLQARIGIPEGKIRFSASATPACLSAGTNAWYIGQGYGVGPTIKRSNIVAKSISAR
jgi:hypothetical protein